MIIHCVSLHNLDAKALDRFDDLRLGHFYFADGFDRANLCGLAVVGNCAVDLIDVIV